MLTLQICSRCKCALEDEGDLVYNVFFNMCIEYIVEGRYVPSVTIEPVCEFLESVGCALSTDIDNQIIYKPLCLTEKESGVYVFCLNHSEENCKI
jgi:hypothetical protein